MCKQMGFERGVLDNLGKTQSYNKESVFVQRCGFGGETLESCHAGGFAPTGTLDLDNGRCDVGTPVAIRITCAGGAFIGKASCGSGAKEDHPMTVVLPPR